MGNRHHDFIPRKDADFDVFFANLAEKVAKNKKKWGIPDEKAAELASLRGKWDEAYQRIAAPHTRTDTLVKNRLRQEGERLIRALKRQHFDHPPVGNEARAEMRLPLKGLPRSANTDPQERIVFDIAYHSQRQIILQFYNEDTMRRGRPFSYFGALIAWGFFDGGAPTLRDLPCMETATRSPHSLEFNEKDRGKKVCVAMRWINKRGQLGPWSDIKWGFVP